MPSLLLSLVVTWVAYLAGFSKWSYKGDPKALKAFRNRSALSGETRELPWASKMWVKHTVRVLGMPIPTCVDYVHSSIINKCFAKRHNGAHITTARHSLKPSRCLWPPSRTCLVACITCLAGGHIAYSSAG